MIHYALVCDAGHAFESWFSSSDGFETQARHGLIACPVCGSVAVDRAIMAPSIARMDRNDSARTMVEPAPAEASDGAQPAAPVALIGEKDLAIRAMLTALHAHVVQNAEAVGPRFAQEALKIHHGESESRPIYGQATPDETRMLQDEGVAFLPLPEPPEGRN